MTRAEGAQKLVRGAAVVLQVALVTVPIVACSGDAGSGLGTDLPSGGDPGASPDAGATVGSPSTASGGGDDAGAVADAAPDAPAKPEVDIDQIPWSTGANVGYGVASKDTGNPRGEAAFIAYAGYNVSLASAEAWATALYRATLRDRGVRWIWAVQGPAQAQYQGREIGNSKIVAALEANATAATNLVLVVGHSSGTFVAHEFLDQVHLDPIAKKVTYFNLDGGSSGLTADIVSQLGHAYFVASHDGGTYSPNAGTMQSLGATYGGYWLNDASSSGCDAGATWCVHVTLVITKPHDPTNADAARDYSDFVNRPVCQSYLDKLLP